MSTAFVVPATGLSIPNIDIGPGVYIDPAGETLEVTPYIQRCIDSGDLIVSTPSGPNWRDIVIAEANGTLSRDSVTVAMGQGALQAGMVLGKQTANGKYYKSPATGADGTEVGCAVLMFPIDTTASDATAEVWNNYAELVAGELSYDSSVDDQSKKDAKNLELRAVGIKVRT